MDGSVSNGPGTVYLVGGGPGDPELLTRKAVRLLAAADFVAYDDLLNPAMLSLVNPDAELLAVGYRGLRTHKRHGAESVLHPDVIAKARAGYMVVRLKCGDPLIFGRGGEEAVELRAAGIPYEFVPGVTAASGAAAYAGMPLNHRGLASSVTLATGHHAIKRAGEVAELPGLDARKLHDGTLVLYMPRANLRASLGLLVEQGASPQTPAAFILSATMPGQQVAVGTIENLADLAAAFPTAAPGLAMIGATVSLGAELSWFRSAGLLAGRRVLVARARAGESTLATKLRSLGADVIEAPLWRVRPLVNYDRLDAIINDLTATTLLFACTASVDMFMTRCCALGKDLRDLPKNPIVAVGKGVGGRLRHYGLQPWREASGSCDQAIASVMAGVPLLANLVLLTSSRGRPELERALTGYAPQLRLVSTYDFESYVPRVVAPPPDLVLLPSSSAASALLTSECGKQLYSVPMLAIGPKTAAAAVAAGADHVEQISVDDVDELIAASIAMLTKISSDNEFGDE